MRHKRAYQHVAEQIEHLIDQGGYSTGTRLPGERELAERLGVCRVTIREAEIALQAIGRIEIRSGAGVFVCEKPVEGGSSLAGVSALELTEARLVVESEAAALAAHNITDDGLAGLAKRIEEMGADHPDPIDGAVKCFHIAIADATENAAISHNVKSLWRMQDEIRNVRTIYEAVFSQESKLRDREYRAILDALRAHDPNASRLAMRAHLQRLLVAVLDVTESLARQEVLKKATSSRERFLTLAKALSD